MVTLISAFAWNPEREREGGREGGREGEREGEREEGREVNDAKIQILQPKTFGAENICKSNSEKIFANCPYCSCCIMVHVLPCLQIFQHIYKLFECTLSHYT